MALDKDSVKLGISILKQINKDAYTHNYLLPYYHIKEKVKYCRTG